MKVTFAKAKTPEASQKLFQEFYQTIRPKENWLQKFIRKLFRLK